MSAAWLMQNPLAGMFGDTSNTVEATQSTEWTGPTIPNYVGMTYEDALKAAESNTAITVYRAYTDEYSEDYPEGEIIAEHERLYEAAVYAAENPEDDYLLDNINRQNLEAYSGFKGGFTVVDSAIEDFESELLPAPSVSVEPISDDSETPKLNIDVDFDDDDEDEDEK